MRFVHTADTHLGFEWSRSPVCHPQGRRRRAEVIFENFRSTVRYALDKEADLFIHSGDLFHKHYLGRAAMDALVEPIIHMARQGVCTVVIPGNHERSSFPSDLFAGTANVYVFDCPRTLSFRFNGHAVGVAGFPFIRKDSRRMFHQALKQTEYSDLKSDVNILVTHQTFDRATVGPGDFVFTGRRPDTVLREACPRDFDYVAAGHIHRFQTLPHPLRPDLKFVYPGSTQRMTLAERDEPKGFVWGELSGDRIDTYFEPLPVYPMEVVEIEAGGKSGPECEKMIRYHFWHLSEDAMVQFRLTGGSRSEDYPDLDFDRLREELPPVMECQFAVRVGKRWVMR